MAVSASAQVPLASGGGNADKVTQNAPGWLVRRWKVGWASGPSFDL